MVRVSGGYDSKMKAFVKFSNQAIEHIQTLWATNTVVRTIYEKNIQFYSKNLKLRTSSLQTNRLNR